MVYSDLRLGSLLRELTPSTFRKTALGLTAAAAMFAGTAAHAGDFTPEQCKLISGVAVSGAKAIGPEKLSKEFKASWRAFLGPNLTCDGPKEIFTPTGEDVDFFNSVKQVLFAPPSRISLTAAGLKSVDPNKKATDLTRPPERRSEAPGPTPISLKAN